MRFLFILFILYTQSLVAGAPVSDLIIGKSLPENSPSTSEAIPPNPANLKSDWWRFFDVEPDILQKRIDTVIQQINAIDQQLPADQKSNIKLSVDRIRENLPVLLELRKKTSPQAPAPLPIQTS